MHEAYEIFHLLNNLDQQIEAIAAYDKNLIIGTRQGCLYMYSLASNNGNPKYSVQLLQLCKNFSKKPIQQIEVIPEDNLLLCLTDNILSTHNINGVNFPLIKTFERTRGASLFALDSKSTTTMTGESSSVARLCVAVRRKIQLYYGKNKEFKEHLVEFDVPEIPKVIAWGQQFLCVGFKNEYSVYDLSTGNRSDLFPISSSKSLDPSIAKFSETTFLLGRDLTTVFVEEDLKKKEINIQKSLKWKEAPINVVWDEPFILGLWENQVVVQSVEPPQFVQSLSELNKARLICRSKPGLMFVSSVAQVWCVSLVDMQRQLKQLLKENQFQLAIDLVNLPGSSVEDKKQTIYSIQLLYAHYLFEKKKYAASMKEFFKVNVDPAEVIDLFPEFSSNQEDNRAKRLTEEDLENALKALIDYLVDFRATIGKGKASSGPENGGSQRNATQQLELIDTTLLKCYLQINDAFVAPVLRRNNCRLEDAEKTLLQCSRYSELIILYQTKGLHNKALQLLRDHAKQSDSSLQGFRGTKNYLQNLGAEHINLIFKFSDWILKEHPEEGLKIFTEDIAQVENLPRAKVLDFLLKEHESLAIPYLEHVIHTWKDTNSQFHDALINKYREKISKKDNITEEELQHTKSKLVAFLEKSTNYIPERILLNFPNDSLFEERAIVLGKLGRHESTLGIYVLILGDVERAIRYCENVYSTDEKRKDVYVTLIKILMNPGQNSALSGPLANVPRHPQTSVPDLETALSILAKHADKISPLKVLSVLPDSVPLNRLKHFLESSLDTQLTLKRRLQILKGLLYAEHMQVQELKHGHESKSVIINDYNVCPVCKKRFGNQSAFIRYPNGEIVHYSCRVDK